MATAGCWQDLAGVELDDQIIKTLQLLGYPSMTPVQAAAIPPLLSSRDVAVDAETGSGKTLSFLLPIAQILLFVKNTRCLVPSPFVRALVIVPTRELAAQVHSVAVSIFDNLPGTVKPVPLIGGATAKNGPGPSKEFSGDMRLVIATPGRLDAAIKADLVPCRRLELLIMDEADRLLDMGFSVCLTSILSRLPKQRRTGLYSATQTREVEELARAGLRNPVRVAVRVETPQPIIGKEEDKGSMNQSEITLEQTAPLTSSRRAIPASLTCYYDVVRNDHKLHHLAQLLAKHSGEKFIVYMLTCACVDFFSRLPLEQLVETIDGQAECKRPFISLHGKMSQSKRTRALATFSIAKDGVLLCTDVAARGLDIPDVDWVVQFDSPQDPDAYVHRVGRTARLGRRGHSLIYLAPHEDAYVEFLKIRKCPVLSYDGDRTDEAADMSCRLGLDMCRKLTEIVQGAILQDRAVLDASEYAFLTYLRAYKEHKCGYLLQFKNLEVGSVARSFSLLRLPRFQEFKKLRAKLDFVADKSICVRDIAYKDKQREQQRQWQIMEALATRTERRNALKAKSKKNGKRGKKRKPDDPTDNTGGNAHGRVHDRASQKDDTTTPADLDEINEEARLMRKLKRGKLSSDQFDKAAGYASPYESLD